MADLNQLMRRTAKAMLPVTLLVGGAFGGTQKIFAAPPAAADTQTQASNVTQQQAYNLFDSLLRDRVFNNIDVEQNLLSRFQNARSNSEWALLAGAYEMGMVNQVNNAVGVALHGAVDDRMDGIMLVKGRYQEAIDKYANWHYTDSNLTFSQVVAKDANKFLVGAHRFQTNVPDYLTRKYIPYYPNDTVVQNLVKLGTRNSTMAMMTPGN